MPNLERSACFRLRAFGWNSPDPEKIAFLAWERVDATILHQGEGDVGPYKLPLWT
jgi:hypothetical protein